MLFVSLALSACTKKDDGVVCLGELLIVAAYECTVLGSASSRPFPSCCLGLAAVLPLSSRKWRVTEAVLGGGCGDLECLVCDGDLDLDGEYERICLISARQFSPWTWCGESLSGLVHSHIGGGGGASNIAVRVGVSVAALATLESLLPTGLSFESACS